jgi:transposase-like protein
MNENVMKTKSIKWVEIGIEVSKNSRYKATCPNCDKSPMEIYDLYPEDSNIKKFERVIKCPICNDFNILLLSKNEHKRLICKAKGVGTL